MDSVDAGDPGLDSPLIFFDGECPLCHRSVAFLLRRDRERTLRFAPLQGELARRMLPDELREIGETATLVLQESGGGPEVRSAAVLGALRYLPAPWSWLGGLRRSKLVTAALDLLYRGIARRRDAMFGRYEECPLPPPEWRSQFLE